MQSARSKFALLATALVMFPLLAWIAWQWSARSSSGSIDAATPIGIGTRVGSSTELDPLEPLPAGSESSRSEAIAVDDAPLVETERGALDDEHFATVVLKGTIFSDRNDLQLAQLFVRPSLFDGMDDFGDEDIHGRRPPRLDANAHADGSFEFDVTSLIRSPGTQLLAQSLSVQVVHPTLVGVTERVLVPSVKRLHSEARIELTTVIHMTQTVVRLLGQAWTLDGAPAAIQVAAIDVTGQDSDDWAGAGKSVGKDHSFALEVRAPAEYAIVAIADGYRPCTRMVSVVRGNEVALAPLVLDHGHSISGKLTLGSRNSVAGATVAAQPAGSFKRVLVAGKSLACFDDGCEWVRRSARVDAGGFYELSELGPRGYSVSTSGVPGAYLANIAAREFVAPSAGADLTLGAVCQVQVTFRGAGQPARTHFGVRQQLAGGGTSFGSQECSADGRATLFLEPGITTTLEVADRKFPVPTCSSGASLEMRVDL